MKYRSLIILLALCFILGATTTIAIAWGCSAWSETNRWKHDWEPEGGYAHLWPTYLRELGWERATQARERVGLGFGVRVYEMYSDTFTKQTDWPAEEIPEFLTIDLFQFGWPASALSWAEPGVSTGAANLNMVNRAYDDAGLHKGAYFPGWFPVRDNDPFVHRVPLTVMPVGFTLNVGFYAVIWLGILLMPRTIRRWVRKRRGCCLGCGYSLTGNVTGVCPECGKA